MGCTHCLAIVLAWLQRFDRQIIVLPSPTCVLSLLSPSHTHTHCYLHCHWHIGTCVWPRAGSTSSHLPRLQGELLTRAVNLTVGESVARSNATAMEQYLAGLRTERDSAKAKADGLAGQLEVVEESRVRVQGYLQSEIQRRDREHAAESAAAAEVMAELDEYQVRMARHGMASRSPTMPCSHGMGCVLVWCMAIQHGVSYFPPVCGV